ncbi:MAG: hypothetical protein IJD30_06380 [Clostridia bacterium]|nr:hypothetical protein [Clostridia bacterium]
MKKIITLILTISILLTLCSCKTDTPAKPANPDLLKHYYTDIYHDYKTKHYKFRLPEFWKGKYVSVVSQGREDFYEADSYSTDESGLLFSIHEYEDKSYQRELDNYTYLCYDKRFDLHYVMTIPETPSYNAEYEEVYNDLAKAIPIVIATFKAEM